MYRMFLLFCLTVLGLFLMSACSANRNEIISIYNFEDFLSINDNLSGDYVLMNDIDFEGYKNENLIGYFSGTLDGNGYSLSNFVIDGEQRFAGVFSGLKGAEIRNITITDYLVEYNQSLKMSLVGSDCRDSILDNIYLEFNDANVNTLEVEHLNFEGIGRTFNSTITNSSIVVDFSMFDIRNIKTLVLNGLGYKLENTNVSQNLVEISLDSSLSIFEMFIVSGLATVIEGIEDNSVADNIVFLDLDLDYTDSNLDVNALDISSISRDLFYFESEVVVQRNLIFNQVSLEGFQNTLTTLNPFVHSVILLNENSPYSQNIVYGTMSKNGRIVNDSTIDNLTEGSVYSETTFPGWNFVEQSYLRSRAFFDENSIEISEKKFRLMTTFLAEMDSQTRE